TASTASLGDRSRTAPGSPRSRQASWGGVVYVHAPMRVHAAGVVLALLATTVLIGLRVAAAPTASGYRHAMAAAPNGDLYEAEPGRGLVLATARGNSRVEGPLPAGLPLALAAAGQRQRGPGQRPEGGGLGARRRLRGHHRRPGRRSGHAPGPPRGDGAGGLSRRRPLRRTRAGAGLRFRRWRPQLGPRPRRLRPPP